MYVAILFLIFLVLAVIAFFEDEKVQDHLWLLVTVAGVLTLYVAFRPAGIDNDYNSYLGYFRNPTGVAASLTEPTFKLINGLARSLGVPLVMFVTYAVLAVPLKVYSIQRISPFWYLSMVVWLSNLFVIQEMTQIRVAVSTGIFLFSIPWLAEGKRLKYTLCAVCATLFHYSAIVLVPLFLLGNKRPSTLKRCILIILPVIAYTSPVVGFEIVKNIPIESFQQKLQMYEDLKLYEGGIWEDINIYNIMALMRLFVYYMLIWKLDFLSGKYPYIPLLVKIFCYSICMYVGLSFLPPVAMRVGELVSIIDCIMFPLLAAVVKPHWLGRLLVILYAAGILVANVFLYKLLEIG